MSRLSLDEKDFQTLVSGGVVKKGDTQIILQDIGYDAMINNIDHAMQNKGS